LVIIDLREQILIVFNALLLRVIAESEHTCIDLDLLLRRQLSLPQIRLLASELLLLCRIRTSFGCIHLVRLSSIFLIEDVCNFTGYVLSQLLAIEHCLPIIAYILYYKLFA